jgi:hypothetical protein
MSLPELLQHYWAIVLGGVTFVMWLGRLESKVTALEKADLLAATQRLEDLQRTKESRAETNVPP